jgi:hypothetical protein
MSELEAVQFEILKNRCDLDLWPLTFKFESDPQNDMYYQCVKFAELYLTELRATAHKKSFTDLQKKKQESIRDVTKENF